MVLYRSFSDTDGCGGRRGKAAQGAAGSVGDVDVEHVAFLFICL